MGNVGISALRDGTSGPFRNVRTLQNVLVSNLGGRLGQCRFRFIGQGAVSIYMYMWTRIYKHESAEIQQKALTLRESRRLHLDEGEVDRGGQVEKYLWRSKLKHKIFTYGL